MTDPFAARPFDGGPTPEETFSLLGDETRIRILLALWDAHDAGPNPEPVPFSVLRDRVGAEDSGGFNYHLDKLEGQFVRRTGDGYTLRQPGYKVVRALMAGSLAGDTPFEPTDLAVECPFCGGTLEASYHDDALYVRCRDCPGMAGGDDYYAGTVSAVAFPSAGVANRTADEAASAYLTWSYNRCRSMVAGVCPECAAEMESEVSVCDSHDRGADFCDDCQSRYAAWVRSTCANCRFSARYPVYYAVLDHPDLVAFFDRRGVDFRAGLTWENWGAVADVEEAVTGSDPLELSLRFRRDGETLLIELDEQLTVLSTAVIGD